MSVYTHIYAYIIDILAAWEWNKGVDQRSLVNVVSLRCSPILRYMYLDNKDIGQGSPWLHGVCTGSTQAKHVVRSVMSWSTRAGSRGQAYGGPRGGIAPTSRWCVGHQGTSR